MGHNNRYEKACTGHLKKYLEHYLMTSDMCLYFNIQGEDIMEHTIAKHHVVSVILLIL